ncbi:hypothetical protein SELMODRAFT_141274 [Selaginella moellendorffii]|uniref:Metallo-beta-lactamase domain-containing protein n=1 Tax=Selaginella moellendorffii TaxID=88036 RepID=D8QV92_SELML|nr:uncharacterized protein LOC9661150 [Selaginella moellendorffii]EFJ36420.1 hypothetical protein SELMODRAFT_141274 [Selaginella moellendorffii]|eukprot:XP_024518526.1 uncharacterized protein LOC9661150 [Selaginella moellendorffii]
MELASTLPTPAKIGSTFCNCSTPRARNRVHCTSTAQATRTLELELTYLEGNSWLWRVSGVSILVDPVLVGNLDFGVPFLYDGAKKNLHKLKLDELGDVDCLLITQSLDDHCHKRTLEPLSKIYPQLQVIATPNAEPILSKIFKQVTYIEPGQETSFRASSKSSLKVTASAGPVLGPPWQRPENGYFVETSDPNARIYIEPHCVFDRKLLQGKTADVVITPVIQQKLPLFTLVSGQEDAVELAKTLQPRYVVPMNNGDLDAKGILAKLLVEVGTVESFKTSLKEVAPRTQVVEPTPGIPLHLTL